MSESRKNRKYATISGSYLKIILKPPREIVAKENKDCGDVWIGERTYFIAGSSSSKQRSSVLSS